METLFEFCKNHIFDELPKYEGEEVYAADLGITLTEGMLCDGTFTYSTEKAKAYIKEWWYDCSEFSDYEKFSFGERSNPFENPELFLAKMVSEGVRTILSRCKIIEKNWQGKIVLTKWRIKTIRRQVGSQYGDDAEELF